MKTGIIMAIPLVLLLLLSGTSSAQNFEGIFKIHVTMPNVDKTSILSVRESKSVMEVKMDSAEVIRVIKDNEAGTTIILHQKNDLKYGYKIYDIPDPTFQEAGTKDETAEVKTEITDEAKMIHGVSCRKYLFTSSFVKAEAWISSEPGFSLSKYYPEFLGNELNPHIYYIRKAADKTGFVMNFSEKLLDGNVQSIVDVDMVQKEISPDVFKPTADYLVLDDTSMKELFKGTLRDAVKKKQWDEFMQLFGTK
ncbi:MAG: DUF4412 domain-containing protein [Saprospiraceae bacterium]